MALAVALVFGDGPKMMLGALAYPDPQLVITTDVTTPPEITAVPAAVVPPAGGGENETLGAVT